MSWHYLQEAEEEFCLQKYLESIPDVQLKLESTKERSYYQDNEITSYKNFRYGMTLKHLMDYCGKIKSTLSPEDFLVKTSVQLGQIMIKTELLMGLMERSLAFGLSIKELSKKLNLKLFLLKIPQISELKDLDEYSKTFPNWGIMHHGVLLDVPSLKHPIKESECGLWLPTPTCHNAKEGGYPAEGKRKSPTLGWEIGGKPNPKFVEWMMGWPIGWTDLSPLETDNLQSWQQQHLIY